MGAIIIKNKIFKALFFVLVIGLTIYGVFNGEDLSEIAQNISDADLKWIVISIFMVLVFVYCESWILRLYFAKLGIKAKRFESFLYSCVGFFFSCVTPSASGGQPAQILYMRKNNISVGISTNVLMCVTMLYKLVLVVIGSGMMLFRMDFVKKYFDDSVWLFYLGITLNVLCVAGMVLLWLRSDWLKKIGDVLISFLHRIHIIRKSEKYTGKLNRFINSYDKSILAIKTDVLLIIQTFVITFVQRICLFSVTAFIYLSYGMHGFSFAEIVILQSVISISVDMLPLPGGSGIAEHLFKIAFGSIFTGELLLPAMVLSRGISYYVQLLLCGVMTIVAHFYFREKQDKVIKQNKR